MLSSRYALVSVCAALVFVLPSPVMAGRSRQRPEAVPAETIDLTVYSAIRREGREHSHVMEYASALMDGVGSRLTGSPNLARAAVWARETLAEIGLANSRLEDWGEFGTGWQQLNAWARIVTPDTQPLWLQAAPWSASTNGPVTAAVTWIDPHMPGDELVKLKGTLKGRIILLGAATPTPQITEPLSHRYSADELRTIEHDDEGEGPNNTLRSGKRAALELLRAEGVAAIIEPSRASDGGGGTGMIVDDNFADIGPEPWARATASPIPHAVMIPEHYGRMLRLIQAGTPVSMQLDIATQITGEHEHGFNVLAEIPGTDPRLAAQVVLAGAHLDSWSAGTGATDDGAGVIIGMEAMRILKAIGAKPRRTIRLALWTGEEQGLYGSRGYVREHLATFAPSDRPKPAGLPAWLAPHGRTIPKPDWARFDVYFNLDAGAGRIRGIYTEGDLAAAAIFRAWVEPLGDIGVTTVTARRAQGSDQESFQAAGLPAFAFIQDPLDYETRAHHSNLDTLERLDVSDLQHAAIVEATFLLNAAQRETMMPRRQDDQ